MKKYSLLALILAITLLLSVMAGCAAKPTEPEAPVESAEPSEAAPAEPSAEEEPSAEPDASAEPEPEPEPEAKTISYPIPGELTFTMTNIYNPNASAVYGNGDYTDAYTYDLLAEKTGVNIEFTMLAESTYTTSLDLIIAGGEYPDFFGRSMGTYDSDHTKAIKDGVILDLNPLMEENAPDWYALIESDPDYKDGLVNNDGSITKVAGWTLNMTTSGLFIRKDWLDKLGMDAPGNLDELTEALRGFTSECGARNALLVDCDLSSGLGSLFNSSAMGFRMLSFQQDAPNSGKLVCALASDGFIDYLLYLNQLFEEGLITDDFLSVSKDNNNFEEQYINGISGIWTDDAKYCYANKPSALENDPNWDALAFNLDQSDNHLIQTKQGGGVGMTVLTISGTCEHPEEALQFVNYGFTQEGMDLVALGEEGVTYTVDESGKVQYTEAITNNPAGYTSERAKYVYLTDAWMPTRQQMKVFEMSYSAEVVAAYDIWSSATGGDDSMLVPREVRLDSDSYSRVNEIATDVVTLFNENAAKVIFGEVNEAGYRGVIDTAYSTGLTEITELYQSAYDKYMAEN